MYTAEKLEDFRLARLAELINGARTPNKNNSNYKENALDWFDIQEVFGKPEGRSIIIEVLSEVVEQSLEKNKNVLSFVGMGAGGGMIAQTLGYKMNRPACTAYDKIREGEDYIKGPFEPEKEYLMIKECWRYGNSSANCIMKLRRRGGRIFTAIAVLDVSEGAKENLKSIGVDAYSLLTIEDLSDISAYEDITHLATQ